MLVEQGLTIVQAEDGTEYTFRPSFLRIGALAAPVDLVGLLVSLGGQSSSRAAIAPPAGYQPTHSHGAIATARHVLQGLADDEDISHLTGWIDEQGWHQGALPHDDQLMLAVHLLRHGMVGKPQKRDEPAEKTEGFDVHIFIASAQVHLGLSAEDAGALSMTEFQQLWQIKFPPQEPKTPSREEYEEQMRQFRQWRKLGG